MGEQPRASTRSPKGDEYDISRGLGLGPRCCFNEVAPEGVITTLASDSRNQLRIMLQPCHPVEGGFDGCGATLGSCAPCFNEVIP